LDSTTFPTGTQLYGMDGANNGRIITLIYNTASTGVQLTFNNSNPNAVAGQQFYLSNKSSVNVANQGSITFVYVSAISPGYWVQIAAT